jgi:hypothetical protein
VSSTISVTVTKILALKTGNKCAAPGCNQKLAVDGNNINGVSVVGEIAHIAGEYLGAARYDSNMTPAQRNAYANLLFLCPTHHTQIDKPGNTYSVATLTQWKADHEAYIDQAIMDSMPDVTFAELEIVARAIADGVAKPFDGDFRLTDPTEKMKRNGITDRSHNMLTMGLAASRDVRDFIAAISLTVPFFEDRLRSGFQDKYDKFWTEGVRGDDLFEALCVYASKYSTDYRVRAASLAVVAHLFEACDVFQR